MVRHIVGVLSLMALVVVVPSNGQFLDDLKKNIGSIGNFFQEQFGSLVSNIQCLGNTGQDEGLQKCKQEVAENWKAETDPQRQGCCKALATKKCFLELAEKKCNKEDVTQVENVLVKSIDGQCKKFVDDPALCGTMTMMPTISCIVISIAVALKLL